MIQLHRNGPDRQTCESVENGNVKTGELIDAGGSAQFGASVSADARRARPPAEPDAARPQERSLELLHRLPMLCPHAGGRSARRQLPPPAGPRRSPAGPGAASHSAPAHAQRDHRHAAAASPGRSPRSPCDRAGRAESRRTRSSPCSGLPRTAHHAKKEAPAFPPLSSLRRSECGFAMSIR